MNISVETPALLSSGFVVKTTDHRGFTPEELAEQALDKIIYVGGQSHPVIRDQAEAFKSQIKSVIISYMKQAVMSHNTTLANRLTEVGHPELIKLLD
jgi:CobQ-like glutamine amidotransferase family enzyme